MLQTYVGTANINGLDYFVDEVVAKHENMVNFLRLRAESTSKKHGIFYRLKLEKNLVSGIKALRVADKDCKKAFKLLTEKCQEFQLIVGTESDFAEIKRCLE